MDDIIIYKRDMGSKFPKGGATTVTSFNIPIEKRPSNHQMITQTVSLN